ncbi:hypothetical protein NDU88_003898 [Pleurodeles waltl]|uniref:Endonuclease/exonuclease/phosphatase domain-containing protein n=1 Tax=Pleurodeles waltl TaxID=8319 RepID=A0AAV7MSF4_PLEWA|nr:hypothetical protein NDU88_003898 [Pleurodeles waltl]
MYDYDIQRGLFEEDLDLLCIGKAGYLTLMLGDFNHKLDPNSSDKLYKELLVDAQIPNSIFPNVECSARDLSLVRTLGPLAGREPAGEAEPGGIAGGEGCDARRGFARGSRGEACPCGPTLDERELAGAVEGPLPRDGGLTVRDRGTGESGTPDAGAADERRWAALRGPHPATVMAR